MAALFVCVLIDYWFVQYVVMCVFKIETKIASINACMLLRKKWVLG